MNEKKKKISECYYQARLIQDLTTNELKDKMMATNCKRLRMMLLYVKFYHDVKKSKIRLDSHEFAIA